MLNQLYTNAAPLVLLLVVALLVVALLESGITFFILAAFMPFVLVTWYVRRQYARHVRQCLDQYSRGPRRS